MSRSNSNAIPLVLALVLSVPSVLGAVAGVATAQTGPAVDMIVVYAARGDVPSDAAFASDGMTVLYRYASIPGVALRGPSGMMDAYRLDSRVVLVEQDQPIQYQMETAVFATKAADVWGTTWWPVAADVDREDPSPLVVDGVPIDGRGITVGVVDSGIDALHPDLWYAPATVPGVTPFEPKVKACVNVNDIISVNGAPDLDQPYCDETVGHGTHVAGIVAGNGWASRNGLSPLNPATAPPMGAAPGASLVGAGLGAADRILGATAGLDWMYTHADEYGIRVVTNSWSTPANPCGSTIPGPSAIDLIVNELVDERGIVVLFAASNYQGSTPTLTSPQANNQHPGVISVANYNDLGSKTRDGDISLSSSNGCMTPSGTGAGANLWTWPDVAAPGSSIMSTLDPTGVLALPGAFGPFYSLMSGTSMATPHVAGIVALMLQANPDLTPAQVERILIETSTPWTDAISASGVTGTTKSWGTVNRANVGFVDPSQCLVTPADAAKAEAGDTSVNAKFPRFTDLAQVQDADLFVCRDFKRGHGLVDAYAAVSKAIALRDETTGTPAITITQPAQGTNVPAGLVDVDGFVDRLGSPNAAPTATLSATPLSGPAPLEVDLTLTGSDSDGAIASWSLDFGDGSADATGSGPLDALLVEHTYSALGSYTATLTVTDDDGATDVASVALSVTGGTGGGLPVADGTIMGDTIGYTEVPVVGGGIAASVLVAAVTSNVGDDAKKYWVGQEVEFQTRNAQSTDPQVAIDASTPATFFIYDDDGSLAAGPFPMTGSQDEDLAGNPLGYAYTAPLFTIPETWGGRYYLAPRLTVGSAEFYATNPGTLGLTPIDVAGPGTLLPGSATSDDGHTIGDADDDGLTPQGEIQWVDAAVTDTELTISIKLGMVPPQPAGDSAFVYDAWVNDINIETFIFGGVQLFDNTHVQSVTGGSATWDTTLNVVTMHIPRDYLATYGADCPCTGHVAAMVGEGLAGGQVAVDLAPNAGDVALRAAFQPAGVKGLDIGMTYGSESDPEATDPAGDAGDVDGFLIVGGNPTPPPGTTPNANLPWMDVRKAWVSRESATQFDVTMKVEDMSGAAPSVDVLGLVTLATNYGAEFCVDNAANTYTATAGDYRGVDQVTCYRLTAVNGALGPSFSALSVQQDGSGGCSVAGLLDAANSKFNVAASTVTWVLNRAQLDVMTISANVGACTTTPIVRGAPPPTDGTVLSRLMGTTGTTARVAASVTTGALGDRSSPALARPYVFGASAPLAASAGADVSGAIDTPIAITGSATGGIPPYAYAWSGIGATFGDASAAATTVSFSTPGTHTIVLQVTDGSGATATDTATVTIAGSSTERVEILVDGEVLASVPVSTSGAAPTASWTTQVDLTGMTGNVHLVADWREADGTLIATAGRDVVIATTDRAFVEIQSPEDDPSGASPLSGIVPVSGIAGHADGVPDAQLNAYGFPIASGSRAGFRATTLEGVIEIPCADCEPLRAPPQVPNQIATPVENQGGNKLQTSITWSAGADPTFNGIDGYWFSVAGYGGGQYRLDEPAFGLPLDIRFFASDLDPQSAQLSPQNGDYLPKLGTVPDGANWAFVYMRRPTAAHPDTVEAHPELTLTPLVVPPSAPQALAAVGAPEAIVLSWLAPANDGGDAVSYKILRDGSPLATTTLLAYTDEPLAAGATHTYTVTAFNGAGDGGSATATGTALSSTSPQLAITSPADGATGVAATTAISGTYAPHGDGNGGGSGTFANTHYFFLLNLNDDACGGLLGFGDHVIAQKLVDNAVDRMGLPAQNVHVFNEDGGALNAADDTANYARLSLAWRTGALFDGPARIAPFTSAFQQATMAAATSEKNGGAPARVFVLQSSHGLQNPAGVTEANPLGDGLFDSAMCLDGEDWSASDFGAMVTSALDAAEAANPGVAIEVSINVDCSFCGGFADSPFQAPMTTAAVSAGVVGENRVVEVGCSWVTECFGNPAITYDYMFNRCAFTGLADTYGPMVVAGEGTGSDGGDLGNEVLVADAAHHEADGVITLEEAYWCGLDQSVQDPDTFGSNGPWAPQQQFQISDRIASDLFTLDGFVVYQYDAGLDLGSRGPHEALATGAPLLRTATADETGDAKTPFADLVGLDVRATSTHIVADIDVADLTLSSMEMEDLVEYRLIINGDIFGVCYALGDNTPYGYSIPNPEAGPGEAGMLSNGNATYDFTANRVHVEIPISDLNDETLPATVYGLSRYGSCFRGSNVDDDRVPDAGELLTSAGDDEVVPGEDEVLVELEGPNDAVLTGVATLDATAGTWTWQPGSALSAGTWTATATHRFDDGSGPLLVDGPASSTFSIAGTSDTTPPGAPGNLRVTGETDSTVSLAWDAATDNVGVAGYRVYRDGALVASPTGLTYTDADLAAATPYDYHVTAVDLANNEGASSNVVAATTDGTTTPTGRVTLRISQLVMGTTTCDTSTVDPCSWTIPLDTTLVEDGHHDLLARYNDEQGNVVTDVIRISIQNGGAIAITSPAAGATVEPDFTVTGSVDGLGGPEVPASSGWVNPDRTIDETSNSWQIAQTSALADVDRAYRLQSGYLGTAPATDGSKNIEVFFSGLAPRTQPNVALPAGWSVRLVGQVALERAVQRYAGVIEDARAPTPGMTSGIGPGSHLLMTMLDEPGSTFACTANFVWKDAQNNVYLGAAGHCFLPGTKTATHGAGADYDPARTSVRVCVAGCTNGGVSGFVITGTTVPLGPVVYARQTGTGGDLGNDFGLVKIPTHLYAQVHTDEPVWGGPTGSGTLDLGEPAVLYGNAGGFGEVFPTMARAGFGSVFASPNTWSAVLPSFQGDSGSALLSGVVDEADVLVGDQAVGVLTHLSGAGPVAGTTMTRARAMATEAGILGLTPILQGESLPTVGPSVPGAPTLAAPTSGNGAVSLSWTPPANDGGSAITGYTVRYGTASGSHPTSVDVGTAIGTTITGLTNGQRYWFVVAARNSVGTGAESNEGSAVPAMATTVPGAPTGVVVVPGDGRLTVGWTAPDNGGATITGYTVRYGTTPGAYGSSHQTSTTTTALTGLVNGQTYHLVVVATNVNGDGPASAEASGTPEAGTPPSYVVEARTVADGVEATPWTAAEDFDGSSWSVPVSDAPVGALTIEARLLRDGDVVSSASRDVTVAEPVNEAPTAYASGPLEVQEGATVTLDGSGSTDPEGAALAYAWTQTGGPAVPLTGAATAFPTFDAPQVDDHMTLTFRLTVTDPRGASDSDDIAIRVADLAFVAIDTANGEAAVDGVTLSRVAAIAGRAHLPLSSPGPNTPPTAAFCGEPVVDGRSVSADASCSTDADGEIVAYSWDLGDGTTASGASLAHTYAEDGSYTLTLSVLDDRGAIDQASFGPFAAVEPQPTGLVADAGDSGYVRLGEALQLSAQAFGNVGATSYAWDTDGDGIADTAGQAVAIDTTGMTPGPRAFTLHVTDSASQSDTDTVLAFVYEPQTTTQTFGNDVLAAVPDEVPGQNTGDSTSGDVDAQTHHHVVTVPAGASRIAATLTWETAQTIATVPDAGGIFCGGCDLIGVSANDFDLYVAAPDPAQNTQSAGWTMPETLAVDAPSAGAWDFRVESYLVVDDRYSLAVATTAAPVDPRPEADQVSDVCFETTTPTLVASATNGASGAWDLDGDGLFETSGLSASAEFAPGAHLVRFRATTPEGYRSTILVALRIEEACATAPPVVVVAVSDTGINLYNKEFAGELVPYPELRDWTTADPANPQTGDAVVRHKLSNAVLPFTRHPSTYIPGFPADVEALTLTLGGGYYKTDDNARLWSKGHGAGGVPLNKWYWVPGTKVIGVIDTTDVAPVNGQPDTTPLLDEDGHGTASASTAVGNTVGSCPRCLLVFAEGLGGDPSFFDKPWIDFVSVSGGSLANVGTPDGGLFGFEEATKAAAERGQTISYAAGNGNENAFLTPEQTYTSNSLGPSWTIKVGAVAPSKAAMHGTGKPVYWSSFGSGTIPAACPSSYVSTCNHSGTSAATPISTGHLAETLLTVRAAIGDTLAGQKSPAQAEGQVQAIAVGDALPASDYLDDGVLQRHELWRVAFHCASSLSGSTGFPGSLPASPVDHAYAGYGISDAAATACTKNVLLNGATMPAAPDADQFFLADHAIRGHLWGRYDGDGDGEQGGHFNGAEEMTPPTQLTLGSVRTLDGATKALRALSTSPVAVTETHYLHQDGCGNGQDNSQYMDRATRAAREGGHGCGGVTTNLDATWTGRAPTQTAFVDGATVTAVVRAFTLVPQTDIQMTGTLYADGLAVGSGTSAPVTSVSLALVTTPCASWVITFQTEADIPAGAQLAFQATTDLGENLAVCYEGGDAASRVTISGFDSDGGGTGTDTPQASIATPAQGATVGPGGSVAITGTATFPATASMQRLFLGRATCGEADDGLKLTPGAAEVGSGAAGCAFTLGAAAPTGVDQFIESYPLVASALPTTLSAGAPIEGAVAFHTQGASPARVKFTVLTSEGEVGSVTKEVLIVGTELDDAVVVPFAIPVPGSIAGRSLSSLQLDVQILQQGAVQWTELSDPNSYIDIPRLASTSGKQVEVAIDDPTFATGLLSVAGAESWTASWSLAGVPEGDHVIYARARTSAGAGPATSRTVHVDSSDPTTTGPATVEVQWVPEGAIPSGAGWVDAPLTPQGSWAYAWNTTGLANGRWDFHARVLDSDGTERDHALFTAQLENQHAPVLDAIGDRTIAENATLSFTVRATDEQGDAITYAATGLPAGATLDALTGAFSWKPGYQDAGDHGVTFTATSTGGSDEESIVIHVLDLETSPIFERLGEQTVAEGASLAFSVHANDADGDAPVYDATGLPAGATFDASTATFAWAPGHFPGHDVKRFTVRFTATDGQTTDVMDVDVVVTDVNRAPTIEPAPQTGHEGALLAFFLTASDPDGDGLTFSADPLPAGATLDPTTGEFRWTPDHAQAGAYTIAFSANDGTLADTQSALVTVLNTDRAPVFDAVPARIVKELSPLSVFLRAVDPDGEPVTYTAITPTGATLTPQVNGSAWLNWTPSAGQHGVYDIEVTATSQALSATKTVHIDVKFLGGLLLERVDGRTVYASPSTTVVVRTNLTNTGPNPDTFDLTVLGDRHYTFAPTTPTITLGPGQKATVEFTVTTPPDWYYGEFQLRVTSQNDTNANRYQLTGVETPVVLTVKLNDTRLSLTGQDVKGHVTAKHLDGTPYVGAHVAVKIQGSLPTGTRTPGSTGTVVTGSDGAAWFDFGQSPLDRTPGRHFVTATTNRPGATEVDSNEAWYNILT